MAKISGKMIDYDEDTLTVVDGQLTLRNYQNTPTTRSTVENSEKKIQKKKLRIKFFQ